ncbi:hypothetical protein X949_5799 [Burkholderia pseudomallei MSHR5609]|nr:hypothetical protein X949_5799 [Burkholderia pseudomallei MSHR5609]
MSFCRDTKATFRKMAAPPHTVDQRRALQSSIHFRSLISSLKRDAYTTRFDSFVLSKSRL